MIRDILGAGLFFPGFRRWAGAAIGRATRRRPQDTSVIDLEPGDLLVLLSDGIYEYHDAHGEQFGEQRVVVVRRSIGEDVRLRPDEQLELLVALVQGADPLDLSPVARDFPDLPLNDAIARVTELPVVIFPVGPVIVTRLVITRLPPVIVMVRPLRLDANTIASLSPSG